MVTVYGDDEKGRVIRYDRHDERHTAIMLLGPTLTIDVDIRPIESGQMKNPDIFPQRGYIGHRRTGG